MLTATLTAFRIYVVHQKEQSLGLNEQFPADNRAVLLLVVSSDSALISEQACITVSQDFLMIWPQKRIVNVQSVTALAL